MKDFKEIVAPSVIAIMAATGVAAGISGNGWPQAVFAGTCVLIVAVTLSVTFLVAAARVRKRIELVMSDDSSEGGDRT